VGHRGRRHGSADPDPVRGPAGPGVSSGRPGRSGLWAVTVAPSLLRKFSVVAGREGPRTGRSDIGGRRDGGTAELTCP